MLSLIILTKLVNAQNAIIKGKIISSIQNSDTRVSIVVSQQFPIRKSWFGFSDKHGNFSIKTTIDTSITQSVLFSINSMQILKIDTLIETKNLNKELIFFIQSRFYELPPLKVSNSAILQKKDTVNYNIEAFRTSKDEVLEDILKRLPGIEVDENGMVKYQGKPINKFYIEGLDLLGNKYSIANRNIAAVNVASVQVLENHQPKKVLDSFAISEQAGLNIKLNSNSKNKILSKIELAAGGTPIIIDAVANAMKFAKSKQFLHVYKFNNIGKNYDIEIGAQKNSSSADISKAVLDQYTFMEIPFVNLPNIQKDRVVFNNLHMLSINTLKKITSDATVQVQMDGTYDDQIRKTYNNSIIFLGVDTLFFNEKQSIQEKPWRLMVQRKYEKNSNDKFLQNTTRLQAFGTLNNGGIYGLAISNQEFTNNQFNVSSQTDILKRNSKSLFEISHFLSGSRLNQQLYVSPNKILNTWLQIGDSLYTRQEIILNTFYNSIIASVNYKFNKLKFAQKISIASISQKILT